MEIQNETYPTSSWPIKIVAAWIICLVALAMAGWTGEYFETHFGMTGRFRQGIHALVMSGIALPGIWWLRTRVDLRSMKGLGFQDFRTSLGHFGRGVSLIAIPMALTILATLAFGWSQVTVDLNLSGVGALIAGILTVLFFEAIPEETVFRGYIYSNLNLVTRRWIASAATVALFVLLPSILLPVQKYVLGMNANLGGSPNLTPDYVILMLLFGSFVQYLRVSSGSVWMSIGFHGTFVLMNRVLSPKESAFIRLTDVVNSQSIQITLLGSLLVMMIIAIVYPIVQKRGRMALEYSHNEAISPGI